MLCAYLDVHLYAQLKHGADMVIVGRNAECMEMEKLSSCRYILAWADARKSVQSKEAVEKTIAIFGRINFGIGGASDSGFLGSFLC